MREKTITTITKDEFKIVEKPNITDEQLFNDYAYISAQKQAELLKESGILSDYEFNKLSALNRKKFCPFMTEILADMT